MGGVASDDKMINAQVDGEGEGYRGWVCLAGSGGCGGRSRGGR